ncbi:MAG: ATP-binding cassette domain-containing protein [Candidatus Omnitrophota bacterium]|nr:ATP-binding cassette domain-containing protein [Candidatus Omnitrophota bacterium]
MVDERRTDEAIEAEAPIMVQVQNISKDFGSVHALDHVSFQIRQGEILGLLGPNGAGKTTAMRILTGYFPPSRGDVWLKGERLFANPNVVKRMIGYLPEEVSLYSDMKVREYLGFVAEIKKVSRRRRKPHIDDYLTRCGLWDVKNRLINQLSKGFRQRVGLAQALIGDPEVLVLDEPTSGLDPKQIIEIRSLIRELGKERTVVLSTHILPEVNMVCDRVLIINEGRVVASGTTDELEAGLKDRHEIFVTIGDRKMKDKAVELLASISGVERVRLVEEKVDQVSFALSATHGADPRSSVSRIFVEHQIPILEIRAGRLSLEEIFMKIVVSEKDSQNYL